MSSSGKAIRFSLVALPVGLFLLGGVAVIVTHCSPDSLHRSTDEHYEKRMEAAQINRKDVNEADLRNYVETLSEKIGERHVGKYESLKKAAVWIESTLGPTNAGYAIRRQKYEVDGKEVWNVVAELRGKKRRKKSSLSVRITIPCLIVRRRMTTALASRR